MNRRRTLTALDIVALTLATVGAINWGLSGAANFNLVRRLFGRGSLLERAVYIVVGLAGLDLAWLTARFISGGYQTPPPQAMTSEMMQRMGRQAGQVGQAVEQTAEQARRGFQQGMQQPSPYQPYQSRP